MKPLRANYPQMSLFGRSAAPQKFDDDDIDAVSELLDLYSDFILKGRDVLNRTGVLREDSLLEIKIDKIGTSYSYLNVRGEGDDKIMYVFTIVDMPGILRIFRISLEKGATGVAFFSRKPKGVLYIGELLARNTEPRLLKYVKPFVEELRKKVGDVVVEQTEQFQSLPPFGGVGSEFGTGYESAAMPFEPTAGDIEALPFPQFDSYGDIPTGPDRLIPIPPPLPPPGGPPPGATKGPAPGVRMATSGAKLVILPEKIHGVRDLICAALGVEFEW